MPDIRLTDPDCQLKLEQEVRHVGEVNMWKVEFSSDSYALGIVRCAFLIAFWEKLPRANWIRIDGGISKILLQSVTHEAKSSQKLQFLFVCCVFNIVQ